MAIAPIQRRRTDPGLQANIVRSALQMAMQEQDARGQIVQRAQAMNQANLRRQDQVFRDVQHGYFKNRQFNADEQQREITNEFRQAQEDRMQAKFEADMALRSELDPLRVKQARATIARTNRVASPDSAITDADLGLPTQPRRSFDSVDARVTPDGLAVAPRGQAPAAPRAVPVLQETAEPALPSAEPPAPAAAPATAPAPGQPALPQQGAPPMVGPPAPDQAFPQEFNMAPARKLEVAEAVAAEAQQEILTEREQEIMNSIELNPAQQQVAESLSVFGDEWAGVTEQYFKNANFKQVLEQRKEQVQQQVKMEKIQVMGEDYGWGQWDAVKYGQFIKGLSDEDLIMGKNAFNLAAQDAMLRRKQAQDPRVRTLTTADKEEINDAWPAPDPKEINAESERLAAEAQVTGLRERYRNAQTTSERLQVESIGREILNDDIVAAALSDLKTEATPPSVDEVDEAVRVVEWFKDNPETRSRPRSESDMRALREAEMKLAEAEEFDMLTPDGRRRRTTTTTPGGASNALFPQAAAPAAAPAAPARGGARKLLGIGRAASLTR